MSDPVLHIKDAFYFEVPKAFAPAAYSKREEFPEIWGRLDPQFQNWEFEKTYHWLATQNITGLPSESDLHHRWEHWQHQDHANAGKPFWRYLEELNATNLAGFASWKAAKVAAANAANKPQDAAQAKLATIQEYLGQKPAAPSAVWFTEHLDRSVNAEKWQAEVSELQHKAWSEYRADDKAPAWSKNKIDAYNSHLSGKILIPQLLGGTTSNLYERESGITVSKFMVIETGVALVLILIFGWIGSRTRPGGSPTGLLWNMMEVFLLFIRDQIARPAIGGHHEEHGHENDKIDAESQGYATATFAREHDKHPVAGAAHEDAHKHDHAHAHASHAHAHHNPFEMADSFVPMLWTLFMFILGCNLCGMIPWLGTPTATISVTLALAGITMLFVVIGGVGQFGPIGFLKNQIPTMELPLVMAIFIKPMIFGIEMFGLLIKHVVLSIRLLANMVAGHLVLLGIMGIAFSAASAEYFMRPDTPGWIYWVAAIASVGASTALSVMELGVAFLQAYVFTLLSALFIGAAVHKH